MSVVFPVFMGYSMHEMCAAWQAYSQENATRAPLGQITRSLYAHIVSYCPIRRHNLTTSIPCVVLGRFRRFDLVIERLVTIYDLDLRLDDNAKKSSLKWAFSLSAWDIRCMKCVPLDKHIHTRTQHGLLWVRSPGPYIRTLFHIVLFDIIISQSPYLVLYRAVEKSSLKWAFSLSAWDIRCMKCVSLDQNIYKRTQHGPLWVRSPGPYMRT